MVVVVVEIVIGGWVGWQRFFQGILILFYLNLNVVGSIAKGTGVSSRFHVGRLGHGALWSRYKDEVVGRGNWMGDLCVLFCFVCWGEQNGMFGGSMPPAHNCSQRARRKRKGKG